MHWSEAFNHDFNHVNSYTCSDSACNDKDIRWRDGTKIIYNASEFKINWNAYDSCSVFKISKYGFEQSSLVAHGCEEIKSFACSAPCDDEGEFSVRTEGKSIFQRPKSETVKKEEIYLFCGWIFCEKM